MMLNQILKIIEAALQDALKEYKFKKMGGTLIWPIHDKMFGALNLGKYAIKRMETLTFNPHLGVRDELVENLILKLLGSDKKYPYKPTLSTNLSNIMGINRQGDWLRLESSPLLINSWFFRSSMDEEKVKEHTKNFINDIITYGIPWVQILANRQEMLKILLLKQPPYSQFNRFTLPALYLVLGRKDDAIDYASKQLEEMKTLRHFGVYESIEEVDKTKINLEEWKPRYPLEMISEYEKFVNYVIKYE
jgi:hypothetical protein